MSDYQFVKTDAGEIESTLISKYSEITGYTPKPADPEMLFIKWMTSVIVAERVNQNHTANQNLPSRATGKNLDALGETLYNTPRILGTAAHCTMRLSLSMPQNTAILIPKGTRFTDQFKRYVWESVSDTYIPIGLQYADFLVECQTAGTEPNNIGEGDINILVDVDYISYYASCCNITAPAGGSDAESDEKYYKRLQESLNRYSVAGAKGAYEYWAKTASSEIADVKAICPNEPCKVEIYALMNDGTVAGAELKKAILDICNVDEIRPFTDIATCEDADAVEYSIELTFYINSATSRSGADIAADVETAIDNYIVWQRGCFGRDINPSKLEHYIMAINGVKRVNIVSPTFTRLSSGDDGENKPEYAVLTSQTVTNGGVEDE